MHFFLVEYSLPGGGIDDLEVRDGCGKHNVKEAKKIS